MAKKVYLAQLNIGSCQITRFASCRNLGATFDKFMNMEDQVKIICKHPISIFQTSVK